MCPEGKVGLHVCAVLFSLRGWLRKRHPKGQEGFYHLNFLECSCFVLL